jgi:hypothetical protein
LKKPGVSGFDTADSSGDRSGNEDKHRSMSGLAATRPNGGREPEKR